MTDIPALMAGKKGLIMGVANERSIAWAIARATAEHGAQLAFTYQGGSLEKRVRPLAERAGSNVVLPCDVKDDGSVDAVFDKLRSGWDGLDSVSYTHLIGWRAIDRE